MRLMVLTYALLIATSGHASERSTATIDDPTYTRAQRLVEVDGKRRLNLYCVGEGTPTVLFDSGLGGNTIQWGLVQPLIGAHTKACSYDRAGLGFSDGGTRPGTSANAVDDMHRLLRAARLKPPYVLVGASYGGMNVRLYAYRYESEVAGLVLVDPSHEDLGIRIWQLEPNFETQYLPYMQSLKECQTIRVEELVLGSELFNRCIGKAEPRFSDPINISDMKLRGSSAHIRAWISEQQNIWFTSGDQVRQARRSLGDMPIIVLTKEPQQPVNNETQALRDAKNAVWAELHDQMAHESTRGERRVVQESGHLIALDRPDAVVKAVLDLIRDRTH